MSIPGPTIPAVPRYAWTKRANSLVGEVQAPLPAIPGHAAHYDHHYVRNGVANLFMMLEPLAGRCHVPVTQQRTKKECAQVVKDLVDRYYPEADRLTLVRDNLSSHQKAALYDVFAPEEAKSIADKIDIHFTPKRGSWLNMAEIGLKMLARQCLDRRIETIQQLSQQVQAWLSQRKKCSAKIKWQFTTDDARIKLHRLYPALQPS